MTNCPGPWSNGQWSPRDTNLICYLDILFFLVSFCTKLDTSARQVVYMDLSGCTLGDQAHNSLDTLMLKGIPTNDKGSWVLRLSSWILSR